MGPVETLLELGSGGGNTASHLKRDLRVTLTDLSPQMLALSETLNPECEHIVATCGRCGSIGRSMRSSIHDAICYMTTEADLRAAMTTAFEHLRPGGAAVFLPDHIRETFAEGTDHGGHDGPGLANGQPGPGPPLPRVDDRSRSRRHDVPGRLRVLLRDVDGSVEVRRDRHVEGLFAAPDLARPAR